MSNVDGQLRWRSVMMNNYGTPKLTLVCGEGVYVWDADGNRYLDLVGGIAVNALGYAHPEVIAAVTKQINILGHTSNLYANPVALEFAEEILAVAGFDDSGAVLFCNSGTEAVEAAFKISRLTGKTKVVSCDNAFHGRTMGALTLTGQTAKSDPFEPLVPDVSHVPYGNIEALKSVVDGETAAVILEPILGEGGVIPASPHYLLAAREVTAAAGALLILDEVQTGMGRTGTWFAFQQYGITPDLVTLAKGFGGGLPLGAVLGVGPAARLLNPGQHGTTFGGNPVCCAAGLATLRTIAANELCAHASAMGNQIKVSVEALQHPLISKVRGSGLLMGIILRQPVAAVVADVASEVGFLLNPVQPNVLRLAPPLIIESQHIRDFVTALPAVLNTAMARKERSW